MKTAIRNDGDKPVYIGGDKITGIRVDPGSTLFLDPYSSTKFYTMPDGNKTTLKPKDGEVFKHQTDPYNHEEWIWDAVKECWGRSNIKQHAKYTGYSHQHVHSSNNLQDDLGELDSYYEDNIKEYDIDMPPIPRFEEPKCDCGCAKTYGKDYPIERHSFYCSLHDTVVELDL